MPEIFLDNKELYSRAHENTSIIPKEFLMEEPNENISEDGDSEVGLTYFDGPEESQRLSDEIQVNWLELESTVTGANETYDEDPDEYDD